MSVEFVVVKNYCASENVSIVDDWILYYGDIIDNECLIIGSQIFSIFEDGTFYEEPCAGGTWSNG